VKIWPLGLEFSLVRGLGSCNTNKERKKKQEKGEGRKDIIGGVSANNDATASIAGRKRRDKLRAHVLRTRIDRERRVLQRVEGDENGGRWRLVCGDLLKEQQGQKIEKGKMYVLGDSVFENGGGVRREKN